MGVTNSMKLAFSTVACPLWTLDRVVTFASEHGYDGVELRSLGESPGQFVSEPMLTAPEKIRTILDSEGIEACGIGTSIKYDEPIFPPVIGRAINDYEQPIRETERMVTVAESIAAPNVRVFGFEIRRGERRSRAIDRIAERLHLAATTARNTGVRLLVENGGSFNTSEELLELIEAVKHPLLGASYSVAVAHAAGERPQDGLTRLGDLVGIIRLKDLAGERPVATGEGDVPLRDAVEFAQSSGYKGWCVVEWPKAWIEDLEDAQTVLPRCIKTLVEWLTPGAKRGGASRSYAAR